MGESAHWWALGCSACAWTLSRKLPKCKVYLQSTTQRQCLETQEDDHPHVHDRNTHLQASQWQNISALPSKSMLTRYKRCMWHIHPYCCMCPLQGKEDYVLLQSLSSDVISGRVFHHMWHIQQHGLMHNIPHVPHELTANVKTAQCYFKSA